MKKKSPLIKMTFNLENKKTADKLKTLAKIYNVPKTQVLNQLVEREFDAVMISTAINSEGKKNFENIS